MSDTVVDLKIIDEGKKMPGFFQRRKRILCIFVVGFCIGFLLEYLFIEHGKNSHNEAFFIKQKDELSKVTLTCIIFLNRDHDKNFIASEKTWLPHCDHHYAFKINRTRVKHEKKREAFTPVDALINLITSHKTCDKEEAVTSEWNRTRKKIIEATSGWNGLCKALQFVKPTKTEWFLIAPDNLFVLVNNLKNFVKDLDSRKGFYLGYVLNNYIADFNTLSAGILISKGSFDALMNLFKTENDCDNSGIKFWRNEDVFLGKYFKELGILPQDTRDEIGRGRFHGYNLNTLLYPGKLFNQSDYTRKALYPHPTGFNCCSPHLITIDVAGADKIYYHYYYLYKIQTKHKSLPKPQPTHPTKDDVFWKEFLRNEGYNESAIENMTQDEYYQIWVKKMPPELFYEKIRKMIE